MDAAASHDSIRRGSLLIAGALVCAGVLISVIAGVLHPEGTDPNAHAEVFATYAVSTLWTAVHLGQFAGMAALVAGLVTLFWALGDGTHEALWPLRMAFVSAVVSLALYGILQAVDGVALKQAVDAWDAATGGEKVSRFAAAETVRWMEWAVRSYHSFVFGAALILFGAAVVSIRRPSRPVGVLMALSGLAYLAQGWIVGTTGFSSLNTFPTLAGIALVVIWSVWLLVDGIRLHSRPAERSSPAVHS